MAVVGLLASVSDVKNILAGIKLLSVMYEALLRAETLEESGDMIMAAHQIIAVVCVCVCVCVRSNVLNCL